MNLKNFTGVQFLLAAALARRWDRDRIVKMIGVNNSYYTNVNKTVDFKLLVAEFVKIPITDDIKEISLKSLYKMISILFSNHAERLGE